MHSYGALMSFFSLFFNKELLEQIVLQTNMYNNTSDNAKAIKYVPPAEIDELKKVLGVIMHMGIERFPNRQQYWKPLLSKFISDANLSINRSKQILSVLHINNNNSQKL